MDSTSSISAGKSKNKASLVKVNHEIPRLGIEDEQNESDKEILPPQNSDSTPKTSEKSTRPIGTKRALEISKQSIALNKGADAIDKLAEASCKRTKLAEEMLKIDKERALIELFSMPNANPQMKERFMLLKQQKALDELERQINQSKPNTQNQSDQSHNPPETQLTQNQSDQSHPPSETELTQNKIDQSHHTQHTQHNPATEASKNLEKEQNNTSANISFFLN